MTTSTSIQNSGELQSRFVELLKITTDAGKAEWAQSSDESGFVYCRIGGDLIVFDMLGGEEAKPVGPTESIGGIVSKCRNATYLWLEGLFGWDILIELLRNAPVDNEKFIQMRRDAHLVPLRVLEEALK